MGALPRIDDFDCDGEWIDGIKNERRHKPCKNKANWMEPIYRYTYCKEHEKVGKMPKLPLCDDLLIKPAARKLRKDHQEVVAESRSMTSSQIEIRGCDGDWAGGGYNGLERIHNSCHNQAIWQCKNLSFAYCEKHRPNMPPDLMSSMYVIGPTHNYNPLDFEGHYMVTPSTSPDYQSLISETCDEIKNLLLKKNADYGDAAFEPKRIFSKASPMEQLRVRIDDKLSRLMNDEELNFKEDTVSDLIGYLILLKITMKIGGS